MQHTTFPVELYGSIAEYAEKGDLVNLMLVSRTLFNEVGRILYRTVDLRIDAEHYSVCKAALHSVYSDKKWADSVITLRINCSVSVQEYPDLCETIAAALRQTIHLRHLILSIGYGPPGLLGLIHGCTFQLHHLEYNNSLDRRYLPTLAALQPLIRHLRIVIFHDKEPLPSSILTHLQGLDGPLNLAKTLLDAGPRPLVRLVWRSYSYELKIYAPFMELKVLKLSDGDFVKNFDLEITSLVPNIQFLKVPFNFWQVSYLTKIIGEGLTLL